MTNQTDITHPIPREFSSNTILPVYHPDHQNTFNSNFIRLTQQRWELNGLYQSLSTLVGHGNSLTQMLLYNLGTSRWNGGSTIFWQQKDHNPTVYIGGLIAKFDRHSGEPVDNYFTTVQELLHDKYGVQPHKPPVPNLIGSHLVNMFPDKPVVICHHPITALVGNHQLSQYTWLATPEHPLVDLTGSSFVRALPTSSPILLIAEPDHEEEWTRAQYVLSTFLSIDSDRRINLIVASSMPGFTGSMARWIANDPFYANWIIDWTIDGSTIPNKKTKQPQHG